jgi:predicted DNA-binding transcriptional regulator YafY
VVRAKGVAVSGRRGGQLARSYHVIALLRAWGGVTLERLAQDTGVTVRTVRRDLEALQTAGLPIADSHEGNAKLWRLVKGAPCPICGVHR